MLRRFVDAHTIVLVLVVVALSGAVALAAIYWRGYARGEPIRSDGVGYYVYLPALFLDHDLSLVRTVDRSFGGNPHAAGDLRPVAHGYLGPHQIGDAILLAPFFAVAQVVAVVPGAPRNGFSSPYHGSATAAGLLYGVVGLALLASYHAFSFAAIAFVLWATVRLTERTTAARALLLGLGMVVAIRPTNAVIALFPPLVGVRALTDARARARALISQPGLLPAGAVGSLAPVIPQLLYWHHLTGRFVVDAYGSNPRLELAHPHHLAVAFSVRKGLFFWTPLVALGVAGLPFLRNRTPALLLATATVLVVSFWIVAGWSQWWYGGSFGQRAFVDSMPLVAIGLAALFDRVRAGRARLPVALAAVLASLLALHGMAEYWLGKIPYDGTTWTVYLHSFTKL